MLFLQLMVAISCMMGLSMNGVLFCADGTPSTEQMQDMSQEDNSDNNADLDTMSGEQSDTKMTDPSQVDGQPENLTPAVESVYPPSDNDTQPIQQEASASVQPPAGELAQPKAPQGVRQPAVGPELPDGQEPDDLGGGIDTLDLEEPSGNWFYKRYWYEKAQERYNNIKERANQVHDMQQPFLSKRAVADKTIFEPLNTNVSLGLGSLSVIIEYLMSEMTKLREKEGILTKQERDFLDVLTAQQKELELLHRDVEAIGKIDNDIEEALEKLTGQISVCRDYEKEAWRNFRNIAKELSDKKAKELYYGILTYYKNIGDIMKYIQNDFSSYFDQLIKTAEEQSQRIQTTVRALNEKGIDFKHHAEKIEKNAQVRDVERIEKEKSHAVQVAVEKTKNELSWYSPLVKAWHSVTGFVQSVWNTITRVVYNGYTKVISLFSSSSSAMAENSTNRDKQMSSMVSHTGLFKAEDSPDLPVSTENVAAQNSTPDQQPPVKDVLQGITPIEETTVGPVTKPQEIADLPEGNQSAQGVSNPQLND